MDINKKGLITSTALMVVAFFITFTISNQVPITLHDDHQLVLIAEGHITHRVPNSYGLQIFSYVYLKLTEFSQLHVRFGQSLFISLSVFISFYLFKEITNYKLSTFSTFLLITMPFFITNFYRYYPFTVPLFLLTILFFVKYLKHEETKYIYTISLLSGLLIADRFIHILLLLSFLTTIFLIKKRLLKKILNYNLKQWSITIILFLIGLSPLIYTIATYDSLIPETLDNFRTTEDNGFLFTKQIQYNIIGFQQALYGSNITSYKDIIRSNTATITYSWMLKAITVLLFMVPLCLLIKKGFIDIPYLIITTLFYTYFGIMLILPIGFISGNYPGTHFYSLKIFVLIPFILVYTISKVNKKILIIFISSFMIINIIFLFSYFQFFRNEELIEIRSGDLSRTHTEVANHVDKNSNVIVPYQNMFGPLKEKGLEIDNLYSYQMNIYPENNKFYKELQNIEKIFIIKPDHNWRTNPRVSNILYFCDGIIKCDDMIEFFREIIKENNFEKQKTIKSTNNKPVYYIYYTDEL